MTSRLVRAVRWAALAVLVTAALLALVAQRWTVALVHVQTLVIALLVEDSVRLGRRVAALEVTVNEPTED